MNVLIKKNGSSSFEEVIIDDKPIGHGGISNIHMMNGANRSEFCVKIYQNINNVECERIQYLVNNPITSAHLATSFRICAPVAMVYSQSRTLIGYMMPLAFENSRDLGILSKNRIGKSLSQLYPNNPDWHNKYELDSDAGLNNRLKIVTNIAIAFHFIHESNKYLIADLKPESILATAKISIVGVDSFQISEGNKLLFAASAYTPGYLAPDAIEFINKKQSIPQSCDNFAAAIVFYSILVGIHPFVGFVVNPNFITNLDGTTEGNIKEGLFAFGENRAHLTIPPNSPHENFNRLPSSVQHLFGEAFSSNTQNRPSMEKWAKVLKTVIKK